MSEQHRLTIVTRGRGSTEITGEIAAIVGAAAVDSGIAHIFVRHTSCGLAITENADPTVRRDLETLLHRWAPDGDPAYRHDLEGDDDMAAHARSLLTGIVADRALRRPPPAARHLAGNLPVRTPHARPPPRNRRHAARVDAGFSRRAWP